MEAYTAADLSADRNEPVDLPLTNETIAAVADFKAKLRRRQRGGSEHNPLARGRPLPQGERAIRHRSC